MLWSKYVLLLLMMIHHSDASTPKIIQYSTKFDGPRKGDGFGFSIAGTRERVAIGAPFDNNLKGVVHIGCGTQIDAPYVADGGSSFGYQVKMNDNFIVIIGRKHPIHIYQAKQPNILKASIPVNGDSILSVAIGDCNTIAAVRHNRIKDECHLFIYEYNGDATWSLHKNFPLGECNHMPNVKLFNILAISGDNLAVGFPYDRKAPCVHIYRKDGKDWSKTQKLAPKRKDGILAFGFSIAMDKDRLVLSLSYEGHVAAIYMLHIDQATGKWIYGEEHNPPGVASFVALKGNVVVATVNEEPESVKYKEVVGVVYRLSSQNSKVWERVAVLKTDGVPLPEQSFNLGVSIINDLVFTGRVSRDNEKQQNTVFVHSIQ